MAFPTTPLDTKIELQLAGVWTDVTSYVYTRDPIKIERGRRDEAEFADPSTCPLTFNNRDGRFSPRNPTGPYYGVLGRNTPVRVSARLGAPRLVTFASGDVFSAPDTAALSITGDIDLRVEAAAPDWSRDLGGSLLSKSTVVGQKSYRIGFNSLGGAFFEWSSDGTAVTQIHSTVPLPQSSGRQAIRATFDVDNGAGGNTVTFYTAPTISGTWAQLGAPVVTAGVATIFNGTSALTAGPNSSGTAGVSIYAAQVYQGIAGTVRANPDFTAQAEGATSFADAAGNTWTVAGAATITARRYRFHGEISSWPSSWDLSGKDVWVPVTASGITRRLGQGAAALKSTIQRAVLTGSPTAYAYWPMEDENGATSVASGLPGGPPMTVTGNPRFASSSDFPSSNPLPELGLAMLGGPVNGYASTDIINMQWLMLVPSGEPSGVIARIFTSGTAARWDVSYVAGGGGGMSVDAYDLAGTSILSSGSGQLVDGKLVAVYLQLVQNGANIDWTVIVNGYVNPTPGIGFWSGTLAGRTVGAAQYAQFNPNQVLDGTVVGHLQVNAAIPDPGPSLSILRGYAGEVAGHRAERLCSEEGIPFTARGNLDDSTPMGAQRPATLLELLAECQAADLGALFEPRDSFGLGYRVRTSMYAQPAALAMDYGDTRSLQPVEDDQQTRNDITVNRLGGSSSRQELTTGALSTQASPGGVGRYDESVTINIATDAALPDQASWRLHLGTVDEARYPVVGVLLESSPFAASAALTSSALDLDVGDLLTISDPPAWLPPDQIRQIVQGFTETLEPFKCEIEVNCTPASPWDVGRWWGDGTSRYDTAGCELAEVLDTTETGVDVTTTSGPVWTTDPAEFPFDLMVGGERMRATACSGAGAAQTFTVTRSVNGVVKTHAVGAKVELADPVYYAL